MDIGSTAPWVWCSPSSAQHVLGTCIWRLWYPTIDFNQHIGIRTTVSLFVYSAFLNYLCLIFMWQTHIEIYLKRRLLMLDRCTDKSIVFTDQERTSWPLNPICPFMTEQPSDACYVLSAESIQGEIHLWHAIYLAQVPSAIYFVCRTYSHMNQLVHMCHKGNLASQTWVEQATWFLGGIRSSWWATGTYWNWWLSCGYLPHCLLNGRCINPWLSRNPFYARARTKYLSIKPLKLGGVSECRPRNSRSTV